MSDLVQFLFIVALPISVVILVPVGLFAVGAFFDACDNPGDLRGRVEALFRQANPAPRGIAKDHYYRPYWVGK